MPRRGLGLYIYGTEGIGKTSFALRFPKPMSFLSFREQGFNFFEAIGEAPKDVQGLDMDDVETAYRYVQSCKDATIVIDSSSGFEHLLHQHLIAKMYEGDTKKFFAWTEGPRNAVPAWMINFEHMLNQKIKAGQHIIILGHAKTSRIVNPQGADFLSYIPDLQEGLRGCFLKWADATLFMSIAVDISVTTEANKRGDILEGKASDHATRLMYCSKANTHSAKNKMNLPAFISMGKSPDEAFKNFWDKVPAPFKD